jgi:hypothetical protein
LQRLNPPAQSNAQVAPAHVAIALPASVEHVLPQVPQLFGSVMVLTQLPLQAVGALAGQVAAQAKVPASAAQTGVDPPHRLPQDPQLAGVDRAPHSVGASDPTVPSLPPPVSTSTVGSSVVASTRATGPPSAVEASSKVTFGNVQAGASEQANSPSSATPRAATDGRGVFVSAPMVSVHRRAPPSACPAKTKIAGLTLMVVLLHRWVVSAGKRDIGLRSGAWQGVCLPPRSL